MAKPQQPPGPQLSADMLGIPGANYQMWSVFSKKGEVPPPPNRPLRDNYRVTVTLTRDLTDERRKLAFGGPEGDSFVRVPKPEQERAPGDHDELTIFSARTTTGGTQKLEIRTFSNKEGRLAKCWVEVEANSFRDAEHVAFDSISPFLSSVAFASDVPIRVTQIDVKQMSTQNASMTYVCPYPDAPLPGPQGLSTPPYIQSLVSLYREGVNSNSQNYQFLCWFKIIEGINWKREEERASKPQGAKQDPKLKVDERLPVTREAMRLALSVAFPTIGTGGLTDTRWDSTIPDDVLGWKFNRIRQQQLEPMRNKIAHMLAESSGDLSLSPDTREHMVEVTKWITLLRYMVRVMVQNEQARLPGPPDLSSALGGAQHIDQMRQRFAKL